MLAKLLALLLQSKAAAVSAVLLVGTTGALVSASTQNGVTTITVTPQATQSTSVSPEDATNAVATDTDTEKDSDKDDADKANTTTTTTSCDTTALRDAVKTVNTTFSQDHTALMHMRRDERTSAATSILESTDKVLKQTREAAVQAILATSTCATQEDQDSENETENDTDKDEHTTTGTQSNTTATSTVTFTETDAKAIADDATNRMNLAFNDAKTKLAALPASGPKKDSNNTHRTSTERPEGHD
jgi:hypothetical protein